MATLSEEPQAVLGATLSRRQFIKSGGILVVGVALVDPDRLVAEVPEVSPRTSLDPTLPGSWIEIHPDNTVLIRTGKPDFGQGSVFTAYRQIVADELGVPFESITTVVQGDTDVTPDGSGAFDFLGQGTPNIRKAAAYTYQALLDLASEQLGVPKDGLSVKDGVVSGQGKSVSYGDLVKGRQLKLTIPVKGDLTSLIGLTIQGDPPTRPVAEYKAIGQSFKNPVIASKVAAAETWVTDVRLPGMLHARVVHPKTLGSTLIAAGEVDKRRFPNAQVVVKGSLVGVLAPTEWEAIQAAEQVANATKWTEWKGLPGDARVYEELRTKADWTSTPVASAETNKGDAGAVLTAAQRKLSATYELSYMKHAPIGPTIAVADVRSDGSVHVYTHTQNPQALRGELALMLGTSADRVVVHSYPGPGHYGRSNGGNAGAEDEAVILSKAVGKPVRVQWMRADDMQWSTQSPASFSDVELAVDEKGRLSAYQIDHFMPAMQDDRLIGAVLAGLPTTPPPNPEGDFIRSTVNNLSDPWVYASVPNVAERGHGTYQVGQKASPSGVGLRDHSMRTPGQFQQNFPRELSMSEAAALAGVDALQFRMDHATEERALGVLRAAREASGWDPRPSPRRDARAAGSEAVRGRGVALLYRSLTYWACVCEVSVTPATGVIRVDRCTVVVDPGVVINPVQLKRQVEGGAVMGIGHALLEEVTFDESGVTQDDWASYAIPTMAHLPEMKVVIVNNSKVGTYGGGAEAANAIAAPAIAAAFHDATGKILRRLPLKPAHVLQALKA